MAFIHMHIYIYLIHIYIYINTHMSAPLHIQHTLTPVCTYTFLYPVIHP
uniref:Uncharacterized protein n=1 Tax=Arundo donax TaxID=35708 RepID=A0A0A9FEV7_ARUDO